MSCVMQGYATTMPLLPPQLLPTPLPPPLPPLPPPPPPLTTTHRQYSPLTTAATAAHRRRTQVKQNVIDFTSEPFVKHTVYPARVYVTFQNQKDRDE